VEAETCNQFHSKGDIVVATDDDVSMPPDWLETLVAPFVRSDVMIVTGNVLPLELETPAQRLFELYGGLGRGSEPRIVNRDWFNQFKRSVPTWNNNHWIGLKFPLSPLTP